ncbi:right-handed parallel beta-helix repeat-containing protein [Gottfriedia acidiceleris]|uniref:right-handed parallel beta-helix repeat-containing protein n=1 Tax=Gottfriedia acidiceleris TaxID=371036 RepID=UPI002FFE3C1D
MGKKIFVKCGQSINAAIATANPGDAIIVEECVYHEAVVVNKNDIRLVAKEPHEAILDGTGTLPGSNGITITAIGVEVNGFKIRNYTGDGIFVGANTHSIKLIDNKIHDVGRNGIELESFDNLIWKNTVKDSGMSGIISTVFRSNSSYIQNRVENVNNFGISSIGCCNNLDNNEIERTGDTAININACCNFITENQVKHSGGSGILTQCCSGIVGNTVKGTDNIGISAINCCSAVVNNYVEDNKSIGIFVANGDNTVVGNNVKNSGSFGIKSGRFGEDLVFRNKVVGSGNNGIDGDVFGFENFSRNLVANSRGSGIAVYGEFNTVLKNEILENENNGVTTNPGIGTQESNFILQNKIEENRGDGIDVNATNNRSVVSNNEINNNGEAGIRISSSFNNIENNEIKENEDGIIVVPTATDTFIARNEVEDNEDTNIINNGANTILFDNDVN